MKVSPQYVVEHYDDVAAAVSNGEVVELSLPEKPTLRLVPSLPIAGKTGPRVLGAGKALLRIPTVEEWAEMDREFQRDWDAKVFPGEPQPEDKD